MNIIIPHSWLKDYLKTSANPEKIAEILTLCSCPVEKLEKIKADYLYHLEITTNRVDLMSTSGIAREAAAALNQVGIKAEFTNDPYKIKLPKTAKNIKELVVKVNHTLCPRFTAVVLKQVLIKKSTKIIQERLAKSGIRSIDSIVDLSNYLMRAFGQPVHTFDYDKISGHKMILRQSRPGEKITTLDNKTFTLAGEDIVIEDGSGALIDLCGIMGGANSCVDKNTRNVLLFIQSYNPINIRRTSMRLGQRSEAAAIFEKGPDPELVLPTLVAACKLAKTNAGVNEFSPIIDLYPQPKRFKKITITQDFINSRLGTDLKIIRSANILKSLGFQVKTQKSLLTVTPPSFRNLDINIKEDLVEEIARIYGYPNLPSVVPLGLPTKLQLQAKSFVWEEKAKNLLADLGFSEIYSYSFISEEQIKMSGVPQKQWVKLKNPLSADFVYMRPALFPSLLQVWQQNKANFGRVALFELANVYLQKESDLPTQKLNLTILSSGDYFYPMKGVVETLLKKLGISFQLQPQQDQAVYLSAGKKLGRVWKINSQITLAELDWEVAASLATEFKTIKPLPKYPPIIEDLTFILPQIAYYNEIADLIKKTNKLISQVTLQDSFQNKLTFRIFYSHPNKSLTDQEVALVRRQIVHNLESKGLQLVGKL